MTGFKIVRMVRCPCGGRAVRGTPGELAAFAGAGVHCSCTRRFVARQGKLAHGAAPFAFEFPAGANEERDP